MTNKNFSMVDGKRIGFAPNLTPRLHRVDSDSIVSRQSLLPILLLCLTLFIGVGNAWGVTFTAGTDTGESSVTKGGVTVSMSTMSRSDNYRCYDKTKISISSTVGNITNISFTYSSNSYKGGFSNSYSPNSTNWTSAKANGQARITKIEVTTASAYTVGWSITSGGGSLSTNSGTTTTVTPTSGWRYANPAYTVLTGAASVSQSTNTFTATPSQNSTIQINMEPIPTHTVTWSVNGNTSNTSIVAEGAAITFPNTATGCDGGSFRGWTANAIDGTQATAPTYVTSANMGNSDITYYAVFATENTGGTTTVTDELTQISGITSTTYTAFSNKTYTSSAVYAGKCAGSNTSIQLNTTSPNGVWTTSSGGKAKRVTVTWNSSTANGRTLDVYGKNSAYASGDLYSSTASTQGTLLGSIVCGTSTELNISGDYAYIGFRSQGSAMYLTKVAIDWSTSAGTTYSDFRTSCCTPLGSINGSINLSQSGSDLVASGWGATTGGNETGYLVKLYNNDKSSVITNGNTDGTANTHTFTNPGAGTYWVSVTPTYSGAGNYCASGDETFSAASIDISGKVVITFKKNGATGTDDQTQEVDYNTETALEDVSARSYTAPSCKEFGGWATSEANATAGTVAYANGANITATEATTLWAIWKTKTFAVTDGTIAASVASHSYSDNPIACGSDLTITCAAAAAYKGNPTVTATGTHGAITVNSATSVTIANVQSAIAVSIAYNTPKETATVILHDATGAHTQDGSYYEADNYTLPNTAAACTESELYGWYTETYVDQPTAPSGEKYIAKEASKALVAGDNHFYAVYATIEDRYTNNYTKITSVGDLTTGDYLIAGISSYCMSNTVNVSNYMNESNMSSHLDDDVITNSSNNNIIWTITKDGDNYTFYNAAATGNKYLGLTTTSPVMQAEPHNFTVTLDGTCLVFSSVTTTGYKLAYSTYFKSLQSKGSDVLLYKRGKAPSAGAPYTTSPSCTSHTLSSAIDPSSPVSGTIELGKTTILEGKTTKATATPSEHYTFSHWTISGTDAELDDATANPVTVTMGTENAIVTAHFTEKEKCTVEFYNNGGSALSSTTYWLGETPTAPTLTDGHDHDACDETSTTHYGWTQTAWTETLTKEQVDAKTAADVKVYAKAAALPAIAAEDDGKTIKYYAVWVKKETSGSEVTKTYGFEDADDASCWTITDAITKTSGQGATGSYAGTINTNDTYITFNDKVKVTNFSFKLKRKTDNSNYSAIIETSADGSNWSAAETYPLSGFGNGSYTSKSKDFDGETALYVRFHCSNTTAVRYVDDISITYDGVTTTYSNFLTTCTPSHSVSSAVDPAGKATVTLGANSVAEGSTTTAEYSAITAGYEFVNWTVSGTGASLDDNTANPTTITMGTADVTITANLQCVKPTFTVHPASKTNYLTTDVATALGYTASAAGASLTQQWQVSNDNSSWDDIDGATSTTYTPNIATEGTKYYRVVVTNSECDESKTSDVATITSIAPSGYCISLFNSNNNGIQSGFSNGGEGNEYTLAFTVPGKDGSSNWPQYWIGENNAWASAYSANANFADMKFTSSDGTLGLAEGATGTLHIWDDNKASGSNLHVKFEPSGYGFRWGDHESDDWTATECTKAFTVDANNANTYWTELVTLDGTNNTAWDYYVGLQTASGYVYSGVDNEASDARGISRTRSVTAMKVSNGTSDQYKATYLDSEPTGTTGKFRIWNNNITDYNFVCHFVPFYQLKYNANGGSGTMDPLPATPVSCEESAENRTVTVAANTFTAPTGKQFVKWNTAANGSGADVAEGAYELTGDVTLYAIWADADYTVTVNQSPNASATTTGQTNAAHYGATINLTTTVPDGYEFVNWTSSDVTITNPTSEDGASFTMPAKNVTVTANFQQIYTITWSANGATTTSTVNAGNKLVLPEDEPATCNDGYSTFIGWYSVAAGSAEEPSANVSGTKADADHTPTGNETYYAVWANGDLVGGWQKTTSIAVGDVVLFVHDVATKKELTGVADNIGTATSYDTELAGTYPLTVMEGSADDSYAFKNGNNYLSYSGSSNNLYTSTELTAASSWTISTSTDGNFRFANANTTTRILQFNNNQYRWACYGNSSQAAFQIYKQIASATEFISGCCEKWTATAKYGESNVINVDDVVDVTVTGTVHGTASYESDDTQVLTVASDGKITGKKAGSATVTISWSGADGYCAYETTVDVTVNGTITVTYNANDGSLTPGTTSQNATSNSPFALNANSFSRTGYTFQGWALTTDGDQAYDDQQADAEFAEDITLYAVWAINSHAVTLNQPTGNTIEATGAANLASVAYGTSITLSATENDGYVFTGWNTSDVVLANTNPVVFTMPDKDVTVTATYSTYTWDFVNYTVAPTPGTIYTDADQFDKSAYTVTANYKRSDTEEPKAVDLAANAWTAKLNGIEIADGYEFVLGDNDKTLSLHVGDALVWSSAIIVTEVDKDRFIDGLWGNATIVKKEADYTVPTLTQRPGDAGSCDNHTVFIGWVLADDAENPTDGNKVVGGTTGQTPTNKTYYAIWAEHYSGNKDFDASKTSFVESEKNGASLNGDISYTTTQNGGTQGPAVVSGGILRLYRKNSGDNVGSYITISAASGVTISAVEFEVSTTHAVKYKAGAYSAGNMDDVAITDGKVTVSGLSATKFTLANADGDHQLDISSISVAYSKHVEEDRDYITDCDPRYDVQFNTDCATGSYDKVTKKAGVEITLPDGSALSKDHHTFAGWYSAHYDVTYSESTSMVYTVPVDGETLVAQWNEDHHAFVHFMDGESEVAGSPIKVYDGGLYNLADAPSAVSGKAFIGWSFDGSMYTAGQQNQHMDDPAEDKTYVAVWMPVIDVATAASADLSDGKWILVQNKSQLKAGDFIVIAAAGYAKALSTNQGENRSAVDVTKTVDTLSITNSVAPLFLQYDPEKDYYALYDRANTGYLYSNNNLKTQASLTMQGLWTIDIANKKASVVAQGKNNDKTMRYNTSGTFSVYLDETKQSDIAIYKWAKNINGATNVSDVANTDMVIVKNGATLTIDEPATLDNVIVEVGGKVTNTNNLTVNDLTIKSEAGKSGQVTNGNKISVNGALYMDVTFFKGATALTAETADRWYMISAPFDVNLSNGFCQVNGTPMVFGQDFDLFEYEGSKRAETGVTGWKRAQGKMNAGVACLIGFNAGQPTTIRLKAASTDLEEKTSISLQAFTGDDDNKNWNGVANPTLHYTDISHDVQTYNNEDGENGRKYIAYTASSTSFVVGTAFFVQETGTMTLSAATHDELRAPKRAEADERYEACVRIFRQEATEFADQMYVRASETALSQYEQGHDMITWNGTTGNTAMIWAENYGKRLAIEEAQLVNDKASYELGIFAPQAGTYRIAMTSEDDAELYLTYNGRAIWNLSMSECELELAQGQNAGYGLRLVVKAPSVVTGIENSEVSDQKSDVQKVIIDEHVYILRGGQMYDVNGKMVK